jgi:hypothetical protein
MEWTGAGQDESTRLDHAKHVPITRYVTQASMFMGGLLGLLILAIGMPSWLSSLDKDQASSALDAYLALPVCDSPDFESWAKYPHFNADRRLPDEAAGMTLTDLDADGDLDLAVGYAVGQTVEVYLNTGGQLFQRDAQNQVAPPISIPADILHNTLAAGDLDGDQKMELIWQTRDRTRLQYWEFDASSTPDVQEFEKTDPMVTPILMDVDGNGCDDVLYTDIGPDPSLSVLRSRCGINFDTADQLQEGWRGLGHAGAHAIGQRRDGQLVLIDAPSELHDSISYESMSSEDLHLELGGPTGIWLSGLPTGLDGGLRLTPTSRTLCRQRSTEARGTMQVFGDIDQDGIADMVTLASCGYCSSSIRILRGVPAQEVLATSD